MSSTSTATETLSTMRSQKWRKLGNKSTIAGTAKAVRPGTTYGDFRDDLLRDGYAVVKNVVPPECCELH